MRNSAVASSGAGAARGAEPAHCTPEAPRSLGPAVAGDTSRRWTRRQEESVSGGGASRELSSVKRSDRRAVGLGTSDATRGPSRSRLSGPIRTLLELLSALELRESLERSSLSSSGAGPFQASSPERSFHSEAARASPEQQPSGRTSGVSGLDLRRAIEDWHLGRLRAGTTNRFRPGSRKTFPVRLR